MNKAKICYFVDTNTRDNYDQEQKLIYILGYLVYIPIYNNLAY